MTKQLFDSNNRLSQANGFYLKEEFCRTDISVHTSVFNVRNVCVGCDQLTFPEFHFETEAKVDFPSACLLQRRQKFEWMFSILNRALSWAITSFGNKFCLKKRSRLIKASDNRFHVKFMQLEIGMLM